MKRRKEENIKTRDSLGVDGLMKKARRKKRKDKDLDQTEHNSLRPHSVCQVNTAGATLLVQSPSVAG